MRRTMNVWVIIAACACLLVIFFWQSNELSAAYDSLNHTSDANAVRITDLEKTNISLRSTLEQVDTDVYTESVARTEYGYMMPDEIRFVISDLELDEEPTD